MVMHVCNHSTQEAEVGGLRVQGQLGLHSQTLSQPSPVHIVHHLSIFVTVV
jgi:hypothetical protein